MTRARETSENARQAKAWISFNGAGTAAINESFNVDSLTDHGTGDYTINFINAMSSAYYCIVAGGNGPINTSATAAHCIPFINFLRTSTASGACVAWFKDENSAHLADPNWAYVVIYQQEKT